MSLINRLAWGVFSFAAICRKGTYLIDLPTHMLRRNISIKMLKIVYRSRTTYSLEIPTRKGETS
jgi:hypothetical protein